MYEIYYDGKPLPHTIERNWAHVYEYDDGRITLWLPLKVCNDLVFKYPNIIVYEGEFEVLRWFNKWELCVEKELPAFVVVNSRRIDLVSTGDDYLEYEIPGYPGVYLGDDPLRFRIAEHIWPEKFVPIGEYAKRLWNSWKQTSR